MNPTAGGFASLFLFAALALLAGGAPGAAAQAAQTAPAGVRPLAERLGHPAGAKLLIVHLAYDDEETRAVALDRPDWGAAWRQRDFDFVTSEAFRRLLKEHDVKLVTWREVGELVARP